MFQARAYAVMPFVWCLGYVLNKSCRQVLLLICLSSIVGSGLGGSFADPVRNYPNIFPEGTILDKFPYLLPNIISAFVVLVGLVVGILFLEETHEKKKFRRDPGLELGRWILRKIKSKGDEYHYSKWADANLDENTPLVSDDQGQRSYGSPNVARADVAAVAEPNQLEHDHEADKIAPKSAASKALTTQVLLNVVSYGILA